MENKKTYTYDEAYKASLEYFVYDELAARVWVSKYAMKDSFGNIYEQSPEDMHWRLAREIARIENKYPNPMSEREVFDLLDHFRYIIPAYSPMTGIGNDHQIASLSNCFVIGIEGDGDSYGAIMRLDEEQVQLMKLPWRSRPRPLADPSQRFARCQFGSYLYRTRAVYGTLQQLYTRSGTGRPSWCADVVCQHQAPGQ